MKVAAYIRVSTGEQADSGIGLEAQRQAIRAEVERRGWTLVGMYEDAGASGKSLSGRRGLQEALRALEDGEASALVVSKLDRLSRSLADFAGLMARAKSREWALVALDLGIDTTTPAGGLVASVMASVAQWEREVIGQRTKEALKLVKQRTPDDLERLSLERGREVKPVGRPKGVSPLSCRVPVKLERRIASMRAEGMSLREIARTLDTEGIPPLRAESWKPQTVLNIARRASDAQVLPQSAL